MDQQSMNQGSNPQNNGGSKKVLWIVLAVLIIGGIVWFLMSRKSTSDTAEVKSGNENTTSQQQAMSKNQSLKDLMASGAAQKCTFSYTDKNNYQSQGQVSVSGGKMRGTFSTTVNGKEMKSNMINDGQNMYVWVDGQATGMKMAAAADAMQQPTQAPQSSQAIDQNASYDYKCTPGGVSESDFSLPAGITFSDMSKMMAPPAASGTGMQGDYSSGDGSVPNKAQMCAACDGAGANKAQCLVSLGCN